MAHVSTTSLGARLVQHLAVLDGPTTGPVDSPSLTVGGVAWWLGLLTLAILGLLYARGRPTFFPLLVGTLAGLGLAVEYLLLIDGIAPRFLLPSYALLSLPAVSTLTGWLQLQRVVGAAVIVALVGPWIIWQVGTADRIEARTAMTRGSLREVGLSLRELSGGQPCSFVSSDGLRQIEYASGCDGARLKDDLSLHIAYLEERTAAGDRTYLISHTASVAEASFATLPIVLILPAPHGQRWFVREFLLSSGDEETGG